MHSFVKDISGFIVNIDFLTTLYGGPENTLMRGVEDELRAIQVEGLGLALASPLTVAVTGSLLSGGVTTESVRVCRPLPFVVLKALAFENRREPKDVYDMVYVLTNFAGTPGDLARIASAEERSEPSFQKARAVLYNRFSAIDRDGPVKYAQFVGDPSVQAVAYAAVQDFLRSL